MSAIYTAAATSAGDGRNGSVRSSDGLIDLTLTSPKEVGGSGTGTNPEQLFAAGYAACFHSALRLAAKDRGITLTNDIVTATIDLVRSDSGFSLAAAITVELSGLNQGTADQLAAEAHRRCPYSKATTGNIPCEVTAKV
jgi:osmotically inducible protein OsmC